MAYHGAMAQMTTAALAQQLGGRLYGPGDLPISGLATLGAAQPGQMSFIGEARYADQWAESQASAALVSEGIELTPGAGRALIVVPDADLALARVLALFAEPIPRPEPGVHPMAVVDPTAELGEGVAVGPFCQIGAEVTIGAGSVLHGSVTVGSESTLGEGCELWPGVVIRERCTVGDRLIAHPNAVVGADGFGYRPAKDQSGAYTHMAKLPQIGTVQLGADVELGAGTCIDRGKFAATVLGDGCKLDNLVQLGHNCELGQHVTIAACAAIGGSVTFGDWALLGGGAAVRDHVQIGAGAQIAGGAGVVRDVPAGAQYAGLPARPAKQTLRIWHALDRLPELVKQLRQR